MGAEDARCPRSRLPSLQLTPAARLRSSSPFQPLSQGRMGIKRKQIKPNGLIAMIFPCLFAVPHGNLKKGKGTLLMCARSWSSLRVPLESDPGQPKINPATSEHPISGSYKPQRANTSACKPTCEARCKSPPQPQRSQLPSPSVPPSPGAIGSSLRQAPAPRLGGALPVALPGGFPSDLAARGLWEYSVPVALCPPGRRAPPGRNFPPPQHISPGPGGFA